MALTTVYNTGTITLANGDTAITGVGTAFEDIGIQPNDVLWNDEGTTSVRIASVTDNTHMVAAKDWGGASLSGDAYEIRITPPSASIAATVRALLELLTNGVLTLLAGLSQTTGNIIQAVDGVWASVTPATMLETVLSTDDNILQHKDGAVTERTIAQLKDDLSSLGEGIVHAHNNGTNISLSGGVYNVIALSTAEFDPSGWYNAGTGKLQPDKPVFMRVSFTANVSHGSTTDAAFVALRQNGSSLRIGTNMWVSAAGIGSIATTVFQFNGTTDYIEFLVYGGSGSSPYIQGLVANTFIDAHRV